MVVKEGTEEVSSVRTWHGQASADIYSTNRLSKPGSASMDPGRRQRCVVPSVIRARLGPRSHMCQGSSSRKAQSERYLSAASSRRSWQPTTPLLTERFRHSACAGLGSTAQPRAAACSEAVLATAVALFLGMPHGSERPQLPLPLRVQGWHSSSLGSSQPPRRMLLVPARGSEGLGRGRALTQRIFPHGNRRGLTNSSSSL